MLDPVGVGPPVADKGPGRTATRTAAKPLQNRTRTEARTGMPLDEAVVADIYRDHAAATPVRRPSRDRPGPARAEDVVQEVILRVWRQAPR